MPALILVRALPRLAPEQEDRIALRRAGLRIRGAIRYATRETGNREPRLEALADVMIDGDGELSRRLPRTVPHEIKIRAAEGVECLL